MSALASAHPHGHVHPRTFDSNGVPIVFVVEGQGEPVVFVHGLYSSIRMNWGSPGTLGLASTRYQAIALDLRGHGHSGKPQAADAYGLEMVGDVIRLLDHLQLPTVHVVGYSMGGMITMKLLTRHADRVRSAVVGGMGWLRPGSPPQEYKGLTPRQRMATPDACPRSFDALSITESEVAAIRVPVTFLVADSDPYLQLYIEPLQRVRQDWPVRVIPQCNHLNCVLKTEFKQAVMEWLDRRRNQG